MPFSEQILPCKYTVYLIFMNQQPNTKTCCECSIEKPLTDFYQRKSGRSYLSCKDCVIVMNQAAYRYNPDVARNRNLKRNYGITLIEYRTLLESQNGGCKICHAPPTPDRALAVDHCHDTGKGILCMPCNTLIGKANEMIPYFEHT